MFGYNGVCGDTMKQMEQFHSRLNQSQQYRDGGLNSYREHLDTMVRSVLREMVTTKQAIVIGAGNCTDVSLPIFLEFMEQVTLTDIDQQAMEQCAKMRRNIATIAVDYTGFSDIHFFELFAEKMWSAKTDLDVEQIVTDALLQTEGFTFLSPLHQQNDLVFVSPIYTQLLFHQVQHELYGLLADGYSEPLARRMSETMLQAMPTILERFNNNLIRLLKPGGTLLVLSDIFEMQEGSEFHRKIVHSIKQKDVMDEIYRQYQSTYGFGLGDYGLYDLNQKLEQKKSRWLLWRFNETRSFAVQLNIYQQPIEGGTI